MSFTLRALKPIFVHNSGFSYVSPDLLNSTKEIGSDQFAEESVRSPTTTSFAAEKFDLTLGIKLLINGSISEKAMPQSSDLRCAKKRKLSTNTDELRPEAKARKARS